MGDILAHGGGGENWWLRLKEVIDNRSGDWFSNEARGLRFPFFLRGMSMINHDEPVDKFEDVGDSSRTVLEVFPDSG
jgi:hypothetical protein